MELLGSKRQTFIELRETACPLVVNIKHMPIVLFEDPIVLFLFSFIGRAFIFSKETTIRIRILCPAFAPICKINNCLIGILDVHVFGYMLIRHGSKLDRKGRQEVRIGRGFVLAKYEPVGPHGIPISEQLHFQMRSLLAVTYAKTLFVAPWRSGVKL